MARAAFHPLAWVAWLAGALAVAVATRNPFYLALLVAAAALAFRYCRRAKAP